MDESRIFFIMGKSGEQAPG